MPTEQAADPEVKLTFVQPFGAVPLTRNVTVPVGAGPPITGTTVADRLTGSLTVAPPAGVADSETPGVAWATG